MEVIKYKEELESGLSNVQKQMIGYLKELRL